VCQYREKNIIPAVLIVTMLLYTVAQDCAPSSVHFSSGIPDFSALLVATHQGVVRLYDSATGRDTGYQCQISKADPAPVTQARWRPFTNARLCSVFVSCDTTGTINWWQAQSKRNLGSLQLEDESLYSLDYAPDGSTLATCGKARVVTVLDDGSRKPVTVLSGHTNRVQSAKYATETIIVSGGWDKCVYIWDIRAGTAPVRDIYGPIIAAADGLDVNRDQILTATNEAESEPIQRWDLGSGKMMGGKSIRCASTFQAFGCLLGPPECVVGQANGIGEVRIGKKIITGLKGPAVSISRDEFRCAISSSYGVHVLKMKEFLN